LPVNGFVVWSGGEERMLLGAHIREER